MIQEYMQELRDIIDAGLEGAILAKGSVVDAMKYSLNGGGKRLRPVLMLATLEAFGVDIALGVKTALAVEMVHTYSLIHDDLPAMDDDDLRRGKPTNHKIYGEAVAILAGDALLTHAFRVIARDDVLPDEMKVQIIKYLTFASGHLSMVGGQAMDIAASDNEITLNQLKDIHNMKTSRLIEFAVASGAIIAGQDEDVVLRLETFASHLGLAFQIKDDILDIEGDQELIGKPVGSDIANKKATYVTLTSLETAKKMLDTEIEKALYQLQVISLLPGVNFDSTKLKEIVLYVKNREK